MVRRYIEAAVVALSLLSAMTACAGPFAEGWREGWTGVQGEDVARVIDGGALAIEPAPEQHIYWAGGRTMHDFAVTARIKFLRADDKYSGFSLFMRWNGDVWTERDAYWVYLRPKFRSLYMQKITGGKLDDEFAEKVEAVRPEATPLNEWMTLRAQVRGRRIEVYLDDELYLSATDDSMFPILSGRVGFGVGNGHVIIADLEQTDLERSERLDVAGYEYVNPPDRGDEDRTVLTDGQVNARDEQAAWRMLGETPEIIFDLGEERFITRVTLRAISSPAVNISSAEVRGGTDREQWRTLATLSNDDSRRAEAEHEITGQVRGIARYLRLILHRPAADQDVELAEVEVHGRAPTDEDREAAAARAYDTGPPLPATTDAGREDEHYWYLRSDLARFAIDREHGLVGGVWSIAHDTKCIERLSDSYHLYTGDGDADADEYGDEVTAVVERSDDTVRLRCRNADMPEIAIEKTYTLSVDGRRLVRRVAFTNTGEAEDRFVTHQTGAIAAEQFRAGGVYMGCDRGLGARLFADDVTVPRQIGALGARNAKVVMLHRYDLGWGVGQFRHRVNDRWCRPVTSRWHERENHPPIYLPNGWRFGVATLHLPPGREQSTEVHFALYDGRQIDFYRVWRNLPETAAAYDSVSRPEWHLDLKTCAGDAIYHLSDDLSAPMLSVERALALVDTGILWDIEQIHGVWGEWSTEGVVESGHGARIDTRWLKGFIARCHERSPRLKLGVYTWAWAVHPRSQVYREHPEWFITRDRSGQVFNAYSNMVLNHARRLGIPESMDELMGQFEAVIRDFDGDFFYLDGGGGGQNLIDWEHLGCDQDYHYEQLYRRIREVTRAQGDDRAVWFNARTGPWFDVGYYEGIDRKLHAATWRESADGLSAVKIRQALDPDQVIVPLYWRTNTVPFFSNYCIGLGITPSRPLGADDLLRKLPYIEAAWETRHLRWLEADLRPDWRVDPDTQVEAYALAFGDSAVLSVIDHREDAGVATVSADTAKLGLAADRPVHVFVYGMRDARESWSALPESLRRDVYRDTGWALEGVARLREVTVIEEPGGRIELELPTERHILTMAVLGNSPARVYSVDGMRANFQGTDVLGASVDGAVANSAVALTAEMPDGGGEVVVVAPAGRRVGGEGVRAVLAGDLRLGIVPLPAGRSTVRLSLEDAPEPGGELAIECPESLRVGETLTIAAPDAGETALVRVSRDDVLLYADEVAVVDGAIALSVPEQVEAGKLYVLVASRLGGRLARGAATVTVTGGFQPELPPWRLPRTQPFTEVEEVDVTARGLHVIGRGTDHHDGRNGPQFGMADAESLRFGGGMADAPVTRYGYGFGSLEFEEARVLRLRITNTCYDAWTFSRGTPSFHPQYTSTYAGMMVDYHTAEGYVKRVALGLGYINPKRENERPRWGTAAAPDEFISLMDAVHEGPEATITIDLARWAPEGWDGRCWVGIGVDNLYPARRLFAEVLEAADSPEGRDILEGESVSDLFRMREYLVGRAEEPPAIDGRLDDAVWQSVQPATGFCLLGKVGSSRQQTSAWAAWDEDNLYVAYRCPESEKEQPTLKPEKIYNRDAVDTALDPDGDRVTFQQVMVDAAGSVGQFTTDPGGQRVAWEVTAAVGEYDGGWTVELAIAWSEMGVAPASGMEMTGNFVRYRPYPPVDEMHTWSPMPGPAINDPARFAVWTLE